MTPLVFLDIDGVLNGMATAVAFKKQYRDTAMSPVSVGLLKSIVEKTGASIVLSATARRHYKSDIECIEYYRSLFYDRYNWPNFPIIGRTGKHPAMYNAETRNCETRGWEIAEWFNDHTEHATTNYLILDDAMDMQEFQMKHLVRTTFVNGLDFITYAKSLRVLGVENDSFMVMAQEGLDRYATTTL
jgi:hypothetical protein